MAQIEDNDGAANWILDLAGITGDSQVTGYEKKIALTSFSMGLTTTTNIPGVATGKPVFQPASLSMMGDSAGPQLIKGILKGEPFQTATVYGLKTLSGPKPFVRLDFTGVYLTQVTSNSAPGKVNVSQFAMYFQSIKFSFWKQVGKTLNSVEPVTYTIAKQKQD